MLKLRDGIVELYRKVATSLPPDVETALRTAHELQAEGTESRAYLGGILEKVKASRKEARPLCEDSGIPVFYITLPRGLGHQSIEETVREATRISTLKVPLNPNAVDALSGENSGDNTGEGLPIIYTQESDSDVLTIDLTLRSARCEMQGRTYRLPDDSLGAGQNTEGIVLCVNDAVSHAGSEGCRPYTIGVGLGGAADQVTRLSHRQLLRKIADKSEDPRLAGLEEKILEAVNRDGAITALSVKAGAMHRHPSVLLVDVALCCWANRRARLIW